MSLLLEGLPRSVHIAGREVPIETGYKAGIRFERLLQDYKLTNREKLEMALRLYFRPGAIRPEEYEAAVDALIGFYRCGRPKIEASADGDGPERDPIYDYEHDAGYIYAAFMQAYHVDLTVDDIHWWQFRALFQALPEDTMFMKIIGYRTAKIPPNASAEQRQRIEEMKRIYALPLSADLQQLTTDLDEILMNGGDPSALLEGARRSCRTTAP